jgi:hypothetical protein
MPRGRPRKNPDPVLWKSTELMGWALGGLEREIAATKDRLTILTGQAAALRKLMAARTEPPHADSGSGGPARRRVMSPEARKRTPEMMKKRWAERRKAR